MKRQRLTKARQNLFLEALAESGIVNVAVTRAGTSRTRVYELRKVDAAFAAAWDAAEETAADRLEEEALRRAVDGVPEPLVSGGKLVRDDDGNPICVQRYSDQMLGLLLRARRPEKFRDQRLVHAGDPAQPIELKVREMTLEQRRARLAELMGTAGPVLAPPEESL